MKPDNINTWIVVISGLISFGFSAGMWISNTAKAAELNDAKIRISVLEQTVKDMKQDMRHFKSNKTDPSHQ